MSVDVNDPTLVRRIFFPFTTLVLTDGALRLLTRKKISGLVSEQFRVISFAKGKAYSCRCNLHIIFFNTTKKSLQFCNKIFARKTKKQIDSRSQVRGNRCNNDIASSFIIIQSSAFCPDRDASQNIHYSKKRQRQRRRR